MFNMGTILLYLAVIFGPILIAGIVVIILAMKYLAKLIGREVAKNFNYDYLAEEIARRNMRYKYNYDQAQKKTNEEKLLEEIINEVEEM